MLKSKLDSEEYVRFSHSFYSLFWFVGLIFEGRGEVYSDIG